MALISSRSTAVMQLCSAGFRCRKRILLRDLRPHSRPISSSDGICDTTLLMQDGMNIEELPLVVKRVSFHNATQVLFRGGESSQNEENVPTNPESGILESEELQEVVEGFRRCNSLHEIFKLLDVVPASFVKPKVALQIVKKMMDLDRLYSAFVEGEPAEEGVKNFTKTAVFNHLMSVILSNDDCDVLIGCLRAMNQNKASRRYLQPYESKILELITLNVTQNKYNVSDVCDIVKEMEVAGHVKSVDKLWVGIVENAHTIDQTNILKVYQTLPCFKRSRTIIANTLLEKMRDCWWTLEGRDLAEIMALTQKTRVHSYDLLQIFGCWLNTKIHSIDEEELLLVINGFSNFEFVNTQVIGALQRYVKARGDLIENPCVFASIMDYCMRFSIRCVPIMEKACSYFIAKGSTLPPVVVKSLFVPFGFLNYSPTRAYEFWKTFESVLDEKFSYFSPEHVLDIMLACVYLERYPLNFVNNVFDPYFLNRLQISCQNWALTKKNLIQFDHIMTNECKGYGGPLVSGERMALMCLDERVKFLLSKLRRPLVEIVGSADRVLVNKCLRSCLQQNTCKVDVLLVPEDAKLPYLKSFDGTKTPFIALLVHLPEHYIFESDDLIGPQATRKRHLEKLGLAVVSLNFSKLVLKCSHPRQMERFLRDTILEAELNYVRK